MRAPRNIVRLPNSQRPRSTPGADGCGADTGGYQSTAEFRFDDIERLALRMLRWTCMSLAAEVDPGIEPNSALLVAQATLGASAGADFAGQLSALLRAIRSERTATFGYMDPDCPGCSTYLTAGEAQVMIVLRTIRCGDEDQLRRLTTVLTHNCSSTRCSDAFFKLGSHLDTFALELELQQSGGRRH